MSAHESLLRKLVPSQLARDLAMLSPVLILILMLLLDSVFPKMPEALQTAAATFYVGLGLLIWMIGMLYTYTLNGPAAERVGWLIVTMFGNLLGVYLFYFARLRRELRSPDGLRCDDRFEKEHGHYKRHPRFKEYLESDAARRFLDSADQRNSFEEWLSSHRPGNNVRVEQVAGGERDIAVL